MPIEKATILSIPQGLTCNQLMPGMEVTVVRRGETGSDIHARGLEIGNFPNNKLLFLEQEQRDKA